MGDAQEPREGSVGRRELVLVCLLALAVFAWPVGRALVDPGVVPLAVDTATVQEPWSSAIEAARIEGEVPPGRPRNPGLADQGVFFYPVYRFVVRSWLQGDPPLWNPWIYAGVPAAGNPQVGVFDPQVAWLVPLHFLGGLSAFHWGLAVNGWLRLAGAAVGAWLLARRLGLGRPGAALAALSFGGSGFLLLWLHGSPAHVAPFLPWILLGLEGTRGRRPGRSAAGAALALGLAILGGHPETAFFVGATAGLWALAILRRERRAGLLALGALAVGTALGAVSLLPFLEYMSRSAALFARRAAGGRGAIDLVAVGVLMLVFGLVLVWRGRHAEADPDSPTSERQRARVDLIGGVGLAVVLVAAAGLLVTRGWATTGGLTLVPDLFGAPGRPPTGYEGPGEYLERAAGWLPLATTALALAGLLSTSTRLARRDLVAGLGVASLLLVLATPGILDLFRHLPLVGLGATVRLACVSALMLGLLAGDALERSGRSERFAAALGVAGWVGLSLVHRPPGELPEVLARVDPPDGLVGFYLRPQPLLETGLVPLEGWVHPDVPVETIRVRVERLRSDGAVDQDSKAEVPAELSATPWTSPANCSDERELPPPDALYFRAPFLPVGRLEEGHWRFSVDLYGGGEAPERIGTRAAGAGTVLRPPRLHPVGFGLIAGVLLVVALLPPGQVGTLLLLALAAAQVLLFARGQNPSVPGDECFPPTRTEEIVAREAGNHRYLAAPGILPANTGMLRDLRALDGYDAMDVVDFNLYRPYALRPGTQALLGWNARGADLASPAFRLLGVGVLATHAPLVHPEWELVAGPPDPAHPDRERAEVYVHRAVDPLPRAFCVPARTTLDAVLADLEGFDPLREAFLEESAAWSPARPMTESAVDELSIGNCHVSLRVRLDGEGLLVLTEQFFPGWRATVDDQPVPILRADAIFRGIPLEAGDHRVVLTYLPASLLWGAGVSLAALIALLALGLR